MPSGNDGRASRRPMPRQLDMSGWGDDSSPAIEDNDRRTSRQADDFNYRQAREDQDRFGNLRRNEYQHRREEPQHSFDWRSSREFDVSSLSSGHSTTGGSTLGTAFTSIDSSGGLRRGGRSMDSHPSDRENNQREINEFSRYDQHESSRRPFADQPRVNRFSSRRERSEHSITRTTEASPYRGVAESAGSLGYGRADNYVGSTHSDGKADSIREAESTTPVTADAEISTNDKEPTHESRTSSLFDNQDERHSSTNSEASLSPTSPYSDSDSIPSKIRDRYPIPSSVSSDRRMRPSSPCSFVSTTRTISSRSKISKGITHSDMSDLRDDLYAFRKQMREVFIRVEDMVDVHRSLFKSDPSTGMPVYREDLEQEAEEQANEAFKELANLRKHFTRLAKDFERSQTSSDGWSVPIQEHRTHTLVPESPSRLKRAQKSALNHSSEGDTSAKKSDVPEDNGSDCISVTSDNTDEASTMEHSRITRENCQLNTNFSTDSTSSYVSPQLQSRWRKNSSVDSVSDISARTRTQRGGSLSSMSDGSSLPDQCSKASESDTDSIFKDFDQRMEQIRSSLNAIAGGKKPHYSTVDSTAVAPKIFTGGGADSPIRAMMAATRTRSTLREASRISRRLEGNSDEEENSRPHSGDREAELRQLLQELNHINAGNDND